MPQLKNKPPKLQTAKNGKCYVSVNGKKRYLGLIGKKETLDKYSQFVSQWVAGDIEIDVSESMPVASLVSLYLDQIKDHIDHRDLSNFKTAAKYLVDLYGLTPVDQFGPKKLKIVRDQFVKAGYTRGHCNKLTNFIRTMFRWAIADEIVPSSVFEGLRCLQPLRKGKTTAPESVPRLDVPDEVVERTLPFLLPTIADMVRVQRAAAMRPSEVCNMRPCDIDQSNEIWLYVPPEHKTTYRGHEHVVALGKMEQEILKRRMAGKQPEDYIFTPAEALEEKYERDRAKRKTKVQPSQVKRNEQRAKNPKRKTNDCYNDQSYNRSIQYALEKANRTESEPIPHWTPYQLRHAAVTEIAETEGLDVARAVAGQKSITVTQRYNHSDVRVAIRSAMKRSEKED